MPLSNKLDHRRETPHRNFARNSIEQSLNKARKRCNSNDLNSTFEIVAGELRARLGVGSALIDARAGHEARGVKAGPGQKAKQHAQPHVSDHAPPVWRAPEGPAGLAAVLVGGGGAWPGFEPTRRAKLTARTARGRVATHRHTQRPGTTGVEGAGGTGGHGRASRSTTPSRRLACGDLAGGRARRRPEHQRCHTATTRGMDGERAGRPRGGRRSVGGTSDNSRIYSPARRSTSCMMRPHTALTHATAATPRTRERQGRICRKSSKP